LEYDKIERAKKGLERYKKHLPEGFEVKLRRSLTGVKKKKKVIKKKSKKKEIIVV